MSSYAIYPTLMDALAYYAGAPTPEGERELIDRINRVPHPSTEQADRGTALNNIVDEIVRPPLDPANTQLASSVIEGVDAIGYVVNEKYYPFDRNLVRELTRRLEGSLCQELVKGVIETSYGDVSLYGYTDYILSTEIVDLKTTSNYTPAKFRDHWQHRVYSYLVTGEGEAIDFTYLVAEVASQKSHLITGRVFEETYRTIHEEAEREIKNYLETQMIPFIEDHRNLITNQRIFGK